MMLGKREMKRTTSMTEISYDDLTTITPSDHQNRPMIISRRNSADYSLTPSTSSRSFLRICSLCNRRLSSARDIFMYRGDSAFCSLECRQQQMTQDEWREKCIHKESNSSSHSTSISSTKADSILAL